MFINIIFKSYITKYKIPFIPKYIAQQVLFTNFNLCISCHIILLQNYIINEI